MSTRENINAAMKDAMKNKEMERLATIRLIIAAMKDKDVASRTDGRNDGIDESAVLSLLQSMIKQRAESSKIFRENNRPELADKEDGEIAVIQSFLPKQLSDDEVAKVIEQIIAETGAAGIKDMGKVMAELKAKYAGQLDMGKAGGVIKQKLSA
ncbi:MAG: glutamyl-tRNA amidotransferase [Micavibrio aeruginosavorus]|uniref:Glutamyl-tRNA amidotransferase n=1 Tax=Micavibrio aeruginosavorus TaxID=349221 RepID=A0A2W5BI97_9BACT|nr:MAG: glutamyl-tRNA amidotransferase [Micavibrio aeruginosavorus]